MTGERVLARQRPEPFRALWPLTAQTFALASGAHFAYLLVAESKAGPKSASR